LILCGERADFCFRVQRIAHFQALHRGDEPPLEFGINFLMHDEAFGRDARLTVIDGTGAHSRFHCFVQVSARHNNERIAPAQFKHGLLDLAASDGGHARASALAASQRSGDHTPISQDLLHGARLDEQRLKDAFGETGSLEDALNSQRALRHIRSVFEKSDVAGHERWRGETKDLPKGEIPRHDGKHRAQRLVAHEATRGVGCDLFVGEETSGVLGVVTTRPRALFNLFNGSLQ